MAENESEFKGVVGRTVEESTPWWPDLDTAPEGAPNVVLVLLDDVGYAQFGCYGSSIRTPTFDRLAANGLRYSNFHTTALCSPTRACLLTGRNHHSNGMARIVEFASGYPGYNATIPKKNGFLSEVLLRNGYSTLAVGKWHLTPATEMAMGSRRDRWPLGRGFERFYGFLGGETDQFHPDLIHDNHQIDPPATPEEGYHLTEDLADKAMLFIKDLRAVAPRKPFFLYFTPGACHAPHQAPGEFIDRYRGQFDAGWDAWRDQVFARQLASGLFPAGTRLSERPDWVPAWDALSPEEQRLYARMMEVYAGFLEHTDHHVGRLLDFIESLGELDNTIVLVMSDNGASAEGGARGTFNEQYFFNLEPESLEENLRRIDDLGTPRAYNHYPWAWAWAGNTPLRRWKRETHEGGVTDPLIVHWPARLGRPGETRRQYVHAVDVFPTLLELIGVSAPPEINGVAQSPVEGNSFAPTLAAGDAPSAHLTQYYEMFGCRALYHDGWKAVTFHPMPTVNYGDGRDPFASFDLDAWELYHVDDDPAETVDLASEQPERLRELVERWWAEAGRFQVLPITNQPARQLDRRFRRDQYVFYAGTGALPEQLAPNLRNRAWTIDAELDVPSEHDGADGVIVSHGANCGGYALYVKDRRLHYVYNFLGTTLTTVAATEALPAGPVVARTVFTPTGMCEGDVALFYGDRPVGEGHVARTTLVTYGLGGGFTVGYQRAAPVTPEYGGHFALDPAVLKRVLVEARGRRAADPQAEERAALARQ